MERLNDMSIKAEELRVGNWIARGGSGEHYQVTPETISDLYSGWIQPSGIPLTDNWLEQFGFKNNTFSEFYKKIGEFSNMCVSFTDYACAHIRENPDIADHTVDGECIYVHQLQNLYFALTGEELVVSPPPPSSTGGDLGE